jgi:LEA14-like dessication related protein
MEFIMKCKICGNEFKRITFLHTSKMHGMTMDEYNEYDPNKIVGLDTEVSLDETEEGEEIISTPMSVSARTKRVFDVPLKDSNRPLSDFLVEFQLSEVELRDIVKKHFEKGSESLTVSQRINLNEKTGVTEAEKLKDKNVVRTTNLHIAEALCDKLKTHKFFEMDRTGQKTWVLHKIS